MTKRTHRSGWLVQKAQGRSHFFDNDKRGSLCGSITLKPREYRLIKRWAFAPNACKRCTKMVAGR